jgi:hypothetical protein
MSFKIHKSDTQARSMRDEGKTFFLFAIIPLLCASFIFDGLKKRARERNYWQMSCRAIFYDITLEKFPRSLTVTAAAVTKGEIACKTITVTDHVRNVARADMYGLLTRLKVRKIH